MSTSDNNDTPATTRTILEIGEVAPNFTLTDDRGRQVSLSDYNGRRVIVYFYPKADTPGCTTEACDFRDSLTELNDAGVDVLGISPDSVEKLEKFRENHDLTFPLLSDPEKKALTAYGAFGEKKNYGKVVQGVIRSTFLINENGTIGLAKYNVKATGHVARIAKDVL
ncbi:thioredoxin-dependent thiol peroxidase [Corynebacterium glyciniphilum]|uniref:thioredoxin-dependent peroxiredoxin n=1 Tax=Corynebacterium glyciniphilum AJ 3170 TaxID=1404245 RepID=X5DNZ6_9CORY|nr:thioredoxin-dependent thiol peroxidase [Corynebacterium glyciniphilum]AHW64898.1 Putative peroxiredoxin [Corynebacterium glyciniphilum AJ 3170]